MANPYRLIVFDWEGTLGDTLGLIVNIVSSVARDKGLAAPSEEKAMEYASYGLQTAIRKLYPEISSELYQELMQSVQMALAKPQEDVYLYLGAEALISSLHKKGYELAVATNKSERSLNKALCISKLKPYFSITRSAGQCQPKPHPEMLEEILERTGNDAQSTLFIGDSTIDIDMANALGIDFVGVDFYHQQEEALLSKGALAVYDNYKDVETFILS